MKLLSLPFWTRASTAVRAVLNFLLPPVCVLCRRPLVPEAEAAPSGSGFCADCELKLTKDDGAACPRCGMAVGPHAPATPNCPACRARRLQYSRVIRLGLYRDELRDALVLGKLATTQPVAAALATLLWQRHHDALRACGATIVVPVPRHWSHRLTRPHHQAETMARTLAARLSLRGDRRLIRKVRRTVDQSSLPRWGRRKNLIRAFSVRPGLSLKGQRVLVVDDILTTGSTAAEMARALRAAGAADVILAVIAVVP